MGRNKMSAIRGLISLVLVGIFLYFTITSIQRYIVAQEELEIANREYEKANAEYKQAQKEFDNVVKYGCENPSVTSDGALVQCPN